MQPTVTLSIVDDVRVVVPDFLDLITPYVLLEQQDWFEDEIKFIRQLLSPGDRVIDIGANYGTYSLTMAKAVGVGGQVWAFEPASQTAELLREGIAANNFGNVVLDRRALSAGKGTAQLSLNDNSELNALVQTGADTYASETVSLTTLDDCLAEYGWRDIAFVKIDAEGEESNILKGGKRFFTSQSPLVQFEIKAGTEYNMALVQEFDALGYVSYRLVPGLDLLVPFAVDPVPDEYLLNLFCCKRDRAVILAESGFLLLPEQCNTDSQALQTGFQGSTHEADNWRQSLANLPYGKLLLPDWERTMAGDASMEVGQALTAYCTSQNRRLSASRRFAALAMAFPMFKELCRLESPFLRLASLARIARDYGARSVAVNALGRLCDRLGQQKSVNPAEPFLVPANRFDYILPGNNPGNWILAAALEELECLIAFSSFYTGLSAKPRLQTIRNLGFGSAEMTRRLDLLERRFGQRV